MHTAGFRWPVTGVVLAGGASRRMGKDKAFLELAGRPLILHVLDRMAELCQEVLIVASDVSRYAGLGTRVVPDVFPGVGVLGGLHAGLRAAQHDLILAVGCDMPFLNPALLRAFVVWAEGYDVVALRRGEQVETLHAAYRRTCLPAMEAVIRAGQQRIISFFPYVRVRYIAREEAEALDPGLRSFRNVNTPQDWESLLAEVERAR
ncbi:MAG: molybdenum cofactor guanylyltransferase [Anaerolineae bacterium]|nr:molybdenum cofactor guanylyltransferase [Anaerolineae bacterium]MDW8067787.1 molybdenum cofactor guanylyltransferase [Anaerolineae bacterium]